MKILIWICGVSALTILLFEVKNAVQSAERHLTQLEKNIHAQEDALRVLRAEWSHLNQPDRLDRLAKAHLDLHPVTPLHIVLSHDIIPPPPVHGKGTDP